MGLYSQLLCMAGNAAPFCCFSSKGISFARFQRQQAGLDQMILRVLTAHAVSQLSGAGTTPTNSPPSALEQAHACERWQAVSQAYCCAGVQRLDSLSDCTRTGLHLSELQESLPPRQVPLELATIVGQSTHQGAASLVQRMPLIGLCRSAHCKHTHAVYA